MVSCAAFLAGCGGSKTIVEPKPFVAENIGTEGGSVHASGGFVATFSPGTFTKTTQVAVDGFPGGVPGLAGPNWVVSGEPIRLNFDTASLKSDGTLQVSMNLPAAKPSQGSYIFAVTGVNSSGRQLGPIIPLNEETSTDSSVTGTVKKSQLDELQGSEGYLFFTGTRGGALGTAFTSEVKAWDGSKFDGKAVAQPNKRVAVVVHGVMSSLGDMQTLGSFLTSAKQKGSSAGYYQAVVGFEYTSNTEIATIGKAFADEIMPIIKDATQVDVFAHSMGTLVSRYAIETKDLTNRIGGKVSHFVSMGGPHGGVPFGDPKWYSTLMYFLPAESKPCLDDLMTKGKGGAPMTSFLTNLNTDTKAPDYNRIQYFTMTGTNINYTYSGYNIGSTVDYVYTQIVGSKVANDGLVAVYTGQDDTLSKRSASWVAGPSFDLTHAEIYSTPTAFKQLQTWLDGWNK